MLKCYIKIDDNFCFLRSILAYLHPCENDHFNRVPNYIYYFDKLIIDGFNFTIGFKNSDMHRFEKANNLSINIIEFNIYQDKNKWKHNLTPIEVSMNESDRVVDLL